MPKIKIVIIFVVAIMLYIIITPSVLGSISMSSIIHYKYDLTKNHDFLEADLFFNSQINNNAYAYVFLQYVTSMDTNNPNDVKSSILNCSTYYFTYNIKPNLGTFTVGCFDNYLSGVNLGSNIDKLKSNWGVKYERPIVTGLSYKVGYFPNEIYNSISQLAPSPDFFTSATTIGLSYTDSHYEADLNLVKFSDSGQILDSDPISYVANLSYKFNSIFKTYLHYCRNYKERYDEILGVLVTVPLVDTPIIINAEYNFHDNPSGSKLFEYNITYPIDKNISISYWRYVRTSNENELRLSIKF